MTLRTDVTTTSFDNLISGDAYFDELITAASEARDRLALHCGPFAMNAVRTIGIGKNAEIDEFTKDGITIMEWMRPSSPGALFMKRMLTFVGHRVDAICHDGTTTSMMLFASLVAEVVSYAKRINNDQRVMASKLSEQLIAELEALIKENTFDLKTLHKEIRKYKPKQSLVQTKYALAYHQALVSSKGDTELAKAIADVVTALPIELFGSYKINTNVRESKERFSVEEQSFDFGFKSNIGNNAFYNAEFGTELKFDDCDLLFTEATFLKNSPSSAFLKAYLLTPEVCAQIEKLKKTHIITPDDERLVHGLDPDVNYITKPFVIISPELNDPTLIDLINIFRTVHRDTPVVFASVQASKRLRTVYESAINATAGTAPFSEVLHANPLASIITDVAIEHRHHYCMISKLYKKDKRLFHPFYLDKAASPFYTRTLEWIAASIRDNDLGHVTKFTPGDIEELVILYRTMACQKIVDLKVGGTSHELAANMPVATDAYGAALSAISDGVVLGGYPKLYFGLYKKYRAISEERAIYPDKAADGTLKVLGELYGVFVVALEKLLDAIYRSTTPPEKWLMGDTKMSYYTPHRTNSGYYTITTAPTYHSPENWVTWFTSPHSAKEVVLVQPVVGYYEQFKRMQDVLPKLINSTCLIDLENM